MSRTLEDLRAALETTPREREHLQLWTNGWSEADRAAARDLLLQAGRAGDHRVPATLSTVIAGEALRHALTDLLERAPERVRVETGWALRDVARIALEQALRDTVEGMRLDHHGLLRAIDLLLAQGAEPYLVSLLDGSPHEELRTILADRLWLAHGLANFPTTWWSGLGLLRRTLTLPLPSFRTPAIAALKRLLASTPAIEGYAPVPAATPIPPALKTAMDDVERGQGAVPDPLLAALTDEERRAALVYAADVALHRSKPRGVTWVGAVAGPAHRDLLDWAAAHRSEPYARAGGDAIARLVP